MISWLYVLSASVDCCVISDLMVVISTFANAYLGRFYLVLVWQVIEPVLILYPTSYSISERNIYSSAPEIING